MATKLGLVDAQFVGFRHGKWNHSDITGLVEAMGLTKAEWKKWKDEYPTITLDENEIEEIDNFFKAQKKQIAV